MVNRSYYPSGEDMPALRRYSSRGPAYGSSHDREPVMNHVIYQNSRPQHMPSHDRSSDRRSPDSDLSSRPRSRIPVACGRCRKRKIKCSGDNGGPCTNCKQAQHDSCQFLRVSSVDTQMKSEVPSYDYDVSNSGAASRMNTRMPLYGPQSYVPHSPLPVETSYPSFRSNTLSTYQLPSRTYYAVPPFNEYSEGQNIDYDPHGSSYQAYGADNLAMPTHFISSGAPRGWNAAPQVARNPLFIDQPETPYNHPGGFHGNNFPLRTQANPESRSLSLNGLTSSLPAPLTIDRLLPIPATHRQMPVAPYHRPSESGLPASNQIGWSNYQGEYPRNTLKSQNMQSISENDSIASYPMASSSPESIASSQMTYNSQQMLMSQQQHQQGDMFTPPGTDSMYATESSDSSYGHSSSGSKRGSHSSQTSHADSTLSALPPMATDSLSNGQRYVPVPYQSTNYPAPPMNNINSIPSNVSAHQTPLLIEN